MAEKLIIWIRNEDVRWLVLDANGNTVGFPQSGTLEDTAELAANRRTIFMLPGERIIAAAARVPGSNPRRILQAAPYALEERLASDVETLHVALLARHADQHCDFLVVERDWLAETLDRIHGAGLRADAAWPDYLGVPAEPGTAHWIIMGDGRLLGREDASGFAAPVDDADFLYAHRDDDVPLRLTVVGTQAPPSSLESAETARLEDDDRVFVEFAAHAGSLPGHGLLQGEFRPRRDEQVKWQRWRWPAVAAAACLVIGLASLALDAWRLERESRFLEQATRDLFQQALPGNQRMVDPRFQVQQALGATDVADSPLLGMIADVAHALQGLQDARLNGFNYRNGTFEMSVTVPDATALEGLRNALTERAGQSVEVQSANSTEDGLEGRLLIGGGESAQ